MPSLHASAKGPGEVRDRDGGGDGKAFLDLTSTSNERLVLQVFCTDVEITPPEKGVLTIDAARPHPPALPHVPGDRDPIIFDFDIFLEPDPVITLHDPPDIP
ncbi:hypothetical protein H4582DRAFT_2062835 [Lactarius indigo]|nr:hypothetical protein H4582DRAFT_2062835 [Lactarius indigo]